MDLARISKAIAGALAAGAGSTTTTAIVVPPTVEMPWWGYVVVGLANAVLAFLVIYQAPANTPPKPG